MSNADELKDLINSTFCKKKEAVFTEFGTLLESLRNSDGKKITLTSSDEQEFIVPLSITSLCVTIQNAVRDIGELHAEHECLPLPNVDAKTLEKILIWLYYRSKNPVPAVAKESEETGSYKKPAYTPKISGWDLDYCNYIKDDAFYSGIWRVMIAANYLQIEPLICLVANFVRSLLKGPDDEDYDEFDESKIRKIFGLEQIYDDSQDETIRAAVNQRVEEIVAAIPEKEMIQAQPS
jgi:hypothetical protein